MAGAACETLARALGCVDLRSRRVAAITLPLMATGMPMLQTYDITGWASWLLPLLVAEWLLRRRTRLATAPV